MINSCQRESVTDRGIGSMKNNFDLGARNQLLENVKRMREIQRQCKQKEASREDCVKGLWKSQKYTHVESKVKQEIQQNPPETPRPNSANFLRAHSRAGPPVKLQTRPCTPDISNKVSVPPASVANDVKLIRHNFDFIKVNAVNAKKTALPRPASLTVLDDHKKRQDELLSQHHLGQVPNYLNKRKKQWEKDEEERKANTPDPAMPPGHRQLPESERTETLSLLQKKQEEVINQMQRLPIGADSVRVRQLRQSLEKQLTQVDEAIKIFSRPKVFVRVET